MKFGLFHEHQMPRPWHNGREQRAFSDALEYVELADRLGIDHLWVAEHHFLEEYSHSSAPEVFLGAVSQRTKRLRLGHGVMLMLPQYTHPARAAARIATLDNLSGGRVEFGTGMSSSRVELDAFGVNREDRVDMWRECVGEACNMLSQCPYPGYEGRWFSLPCRNVVPKPVQGPHPPLWSACMGAESIMRAARAGMGALTFGLTYSEDDLRRMVDSYYKTLRKECVPLGHTVNANFACTVFMDCHPNAETAVERSKQSVGFFTHSFGHYYLEGSHRPGVTHLAEVPESATAKKIFGAGQVNCIGSPSELRDQLEVFSRAGVDQVIFLQQVGNAPHEQICESLELFAREVLPAHRDGEAKRIEEKQRRLAEDIEQALRRKPEVRRRPTSDIPAVNTFPRGW